MKEKEEKRVPQLRFPEFTDDWEQRKLGEIVNFLDTQRKPLTENVREKGPYPYYGASGIVDYVSGYIFNEELILLSEDGANITDRNYPVCFLASGKYWVNNHAHVLKAAEKMDNNFVCNALERKDYSNYNTGMAMPKLNQDTCRQIPVDCPSYEEQKQIGRYLAALDHLITLHQRKLEKLKELKKGLVQKLFSQEVRFKADDGSEFPEWEEKKLGDVTSQYKVRNKKRLPLEIYSVNNIVGFIPQSEQFDDAGYLKDTDTSIYMVVPPKHFAYNPARLDIGSIGFQCLDHDVQVSSLYEVFETSDLVNDRFLWSWFHTYYFNNVVKRLQEGGVRLYFYYDKMQEVKIRLPSLPEQQKIADCLSTLDDVIEKQKETLAAWEELKKGLLQQMFV